MVNFDKAPLNIHCSLRSDAKLCSSIQPSIPPTISMDKVQRLLLTTVKSRIQAERKFAIASFTPASKRVKNRFRRMTTRTAPLISDPYLRHLFDGDSSLNVYSKDIVNLSVGAPGPDLLERCTELMSKATRHRLEEEEKEGKYYLFQYGITAGLWECREELAKFLTRRYGDPVSRENLILTCGATHGLQLLLTSVLAPNGVIFVDEVTYMIALEAFKQFPLITIVSVPMKDDVVDLDALEKTVQAYRPPTKDDEKIFWGMYYTVPTFHNPTGMSITPEMSERLVDISRKHEFAVVCDDVYNLLHYENEYPPHRLFRYDDPKDPNYRVGNVISNGSFSKIFSPAIRVGWLECGPGVAKVLRESGILKSGGAVNHYVSGLIASLLQLKLEDEYLDNLIKTYKERMKCLCDSLDQNLPVECSYRHPGGGYFVWIKMPEDIDAHPFMQWCQKKYKVMAIPGVRFSHKGQSKNYIRVSIAFHSAETIRDAATKLCCAIKEYCAIQRDTKL